MTVLIVLNALGTLYGFWWYKDQLLTTPIYMWPLTPDFPLISLVFGLYLYWLRQRMIWKKNWQSVVAWIAVLGSFKYGIWTIIVIGKYMLSPGYQSDFSDWILLASHLGLLAEGMVYRRYLPPFLKIYGLAMGWFLLNDYADWLLLIHPRLPQPEEFSFAMWLGIFLTFGIYFLGRSMLKLAMATPQNRQQRKHGATR